MKEGNMKYIIILIILTIYILKREKGLYVTQENAYSVGLNVKTFEIYCVYMTSSANVKFVN